MALIRCPECGAEVSNKATSCPRCAYPFKEIQRNLYVSMAFDSVQNQLFNNGCYVYDVNGKELATCKQGETLSFKCEQPMTVTVKMSGCFGKSKVNVNPGDKYQVSLRGFGKVSVQKVDVITGTKTWRY